MRISDWSSDVCSSDLRRRQALRHVVLHRDGVLELRVLHHVQDRREGFGLYHLGLVVQAGDQRRQHEVALALGQDRKSVVSGKSVSVRVDLGGRRILKKKTTN